MSDLAKSSVPSLARERWSQSPERTTTLAGKQTTMRLAQSTLWQKSNSFERRDFSGCGMYCPELSRWFFDLLIS